MHTNAYLTDYLPEYQAMRAAAVRVEGDLLRRLVKACQGNPWLKVGGVDFEDDPCMESDYPYYLERYDDRTMLRKFFEHGNWSIRTAVQHGDLIFVNQVNGGDEWWTLKVDGESLVPFESLTWGRIIEGGKFDRQLDSMLAADVATCKSLDY
jgi:hypothetical protein